MRARDDALDYSLVSVVYRYALIFAVQLYAIGYGVGGTLGVCTCTKEKFVHSDYQILMKKANPKNDQKAPLKVTRLLISFDSPRMLSWKIKKLKRQ